ncbi:MAG: hypothetical protein WC760_03870 [Bacteroidia bacterium]|jgi:hypothetical protein
MKKLLIIAAFVALGASAYAQEPVKQKAKETTELQAPVNAPKDANVSNTTTVTKDADKKECTTAEKKACGDTKKGKSCCSHKSKTASKD